MWDELLQHPFGHLQQAESDILQENAKKILYPADISNLSLSGYRLLELHCSCWDRLTICKCKVKINNITSIWYILVERKRWSKQCVSNIPILIFDWLTKWLDWQVVTCQLCCWPHYILFYFVVYLWNFLMIFTFIIS